MTSRLGDSFVADYSRKLSSFESFARRELSSIISRLGVSGQHRVLDLGCGAGLVTGLFANHTKDVWAADISFAHASRAVRNAPATRLVVADASHLPFGSTSFDWIWCCNTINHVEEPICALAALRSLLSPGGKLALAQSHIVPEVFFAWDYHLDARVRTACHAYYRDKNGLTEADTAAAPRLLGMVRDAGFEAVSVRTETIERWAPVTEADREYFANVFESYWGEKLSGYLSEEDRIAVDLLCDPSLPTFAPDRPDFHHIQTLTVIEATTA